MRAVLLAIALAASGLALPQIPARAQTQTVVPTLAIADRQSSRTYTAKELLADPATRTITTAHDPIYGFSMTYRAVPTANVLKTLKIGSDDYVQARATDNFSIGVPARLLKLGTTSDTQAFVAIEDPAQPWPALPGDAQKKGSAGPFAVVWRTTDAAAISSEYWVYHLAALTITDSPVKRWPGLGVDAKVPADDPIRRGFDRFVAVCMACHRFDGEGEGTQGPDLGKPMNPVNYFQPEALRKLLRDPTSVRTWPDRKMPAFDAASLPDTDIDAIVAWLGYKAARRR